MAFRTFSKRKLMEVSEQALTTAAVNGERGSSHSVAAERLLEDSQGFVAWEAQHDRLMAQVAGRSTVGGQLYSLREQALSQIHRKSLFEVLRTGDWNHDERRYFFRYLYGRRGDEFAAILNEHREFVQSASSHYCLLAIGDRFMHDAVFDTWLADYAADYNRYIELYILNVLEEGGLRNDPTGELRAAQKSRLVDARRQILSVPRVPKRSRTGELLRVATGDTARLPRLVLGKAKRISTG
ncbi:MAG: hypothetical protein AAFX44_19125 [Pseudomonadota bacterium]